jgi:hypothetical protein
MNTPSVSNHGGVEQLFQSLTGDAAIDQGAPVGLDVTKIAAATSVRGLVIGDYNAVAAFVAEPTAANIQGFQGIAEKAFAAGDKKRIVSWGPTRARVYNPYGTTLPLAVGDLLYAVPAQDYLIPGLHHSNGTTLEVVANCNAMPRAMVRKAVSLVTVTTTLVEVYVFPPEAPQVIRYSRYIGGGASATGNIYVGVTRGYGRVLRVGFGCDTGGGAGSLAILCTVGARTILGTAITVANDCSDPCHTFCRTSGGGGVVANLGTSGSYGVLTATLTDLNCSPGEAIVAAITNSSSFVGTGCVLDVDILHY